MAPFISLMVALLLVLATGPVFYFSVMITVSKNLILHTFDTIFIPGTMATFSVGLILNFGLIVFSLLVLFGWVLLPAVCMTGFWNNPEAKDFKITSKIRDFSLFSS